MLIPPHAPQNPEEAAYASFALIEVLLQRLELAGTFTDGDIRAIVQTAVANLQISRQARAAARRVSSETPCLARSNSVALVLGMRGPLRMRGRL